MPDDVIPSDSNPNPNPTPTIESIDQIPRHLRDQIEAQNKRGLQKTIAEQRRQLEDLGRLQQESTNFLGLLRDSGIQFEEGSDVADVADRITESLDSLKSEKQRIEEESKRQAKALETAKQAAAATEAELHDTLIFNQLYRELGDNRAVSPKAAELLAKELRQFGKVGDGRKVTFEMEVPGEDGNTAKQHVTAGDAVKNLEANAEWRHFFRSTVNAGTGGEVVDGVKRTDSGTVDMAELAKDPQKFFDIMDKNPQLIEDAMASVK